MGLRATFRHLFHPQRSNNHRPRVLHPEAYLAFVGIAAVFIGLEILLTRSSSKMGDVLGFSSSITPSEVVNLTNAERAKHSLPPLTVNPALNEAALMKAQDMLAQQYWAHNSPSGVQPWAFFDRSKYEYSVAGENLARDFSNSPNMMKAWMASPTHKANIVHNKYQEIGVAVVDGKLEGVETTLVVQFFGTPISGAPQIPVAGSSTGQVVKDVAQDVVENLPTLSFAEESTLTTAQAMVQPEVLSSVAFRVTDLSAPPLFSPLQLTKAFFLAILCIVVLTLIYDMAVIQYQATPRIVGKNFAHLMFLSVVIFLVVYFKSGVIY